MTTILSRHQWFDSEISMPRSHYLMSCQGLICTPSGPLGPVSIYKKYYRKISWSLEVARFMFRTTRSLWNSTGTLTACQISKRCHILKCQSCGFETSGDLMIRRLIGYWNGAHVGLEKVSTKLRSVKATAVLITKMFLFLKERPHAAIDNFF